MAINTVKDFATAEKTTAQAALTQASTDLEGAKGAVFAAQDWRQKKASDVDQLKQANNQLRAQLAQIATPADATQILADLGANTTSMRSAQKAYATAVRQLDIAQRTLVRAQARVVRATTAFAQTDPQLAWATKDDADNDGWRNAAKQAPLITLPTDAGTAMTAAGSAYKKATARLKADVPDQLLARALERGRAAAAQPAAAASREQAIEDLADSTAQAQTLNEVPVRRTAYLRAQRAVRDYATQAPAAYDRALALLAPIPTAPPLSTDETTRINDNGVVTAGEAAILAERDLANAGDALNQATWKLEIDTLTVQAALGDPTTDTGVQTDQGAIGPKQQDLTAKQTAYTPAKQASLAEWELAVPDTTWQMVADFLEADSILNDLKSTDPSDTTGLLKTLADSEAAYAGALETQAQQQRANQAVQDALADQADVAAATASSAPAGELSAVRGDA